MYDQYSSQRYINYSGHMKSDYLYKKKKQEKNHSNTHGFICVSTICVCVCVCMKMRGGDYQEIPVVHPIRRCEQIF